MTKETPSAKILSFEQDAEFYYEKFERLADDYRYPDALVCIRQALEKDPDNEEYALSMSELLTEMGIFEESNVILFGMFYGKSDYSGDILFNMGCNFYGLREYEKAQECFSQYLEKYPEGDFVPDAEDMLDLLEEDSEEFGEDLSKEDLSQASEGKYRINTCDFNGASDILKDLSEKNPEVLYIRNNHALAAYCAGNINEAIAISNNVLKQDPQNLHAICNLALFHHVNGVADKDNVFLTRMYGLVPQDGDDSLKLLLTLCEMGDHERAYTKLGPLFDDRPYDSRVLFIAGIICSNLGKYRESLEYFTTMLKIDPLDSIALYYKKQVTDALEGKELPVFGYHYQVPPEEIRRRLDYLNHCIQSSEDELRALWSSRDMLLKSTLLWGVYLSDHNIKRLSLELLNALGDEDAIRELKRYILKESEPNELKNDVFIMLNAHQVPQPYIAYINGRVAEVRIGSMDAEHGIRKCHRDVLECIAGSPYAVAQKELLTHSVNLMNGYFSKLGKPPQMRSTAAWAAGILYQCFLLHYPEKTPDFGELCDAFGVTKPAVRRVLSKLDQTFREES